MYYIKIQVSHSETFIDVLPVVLKILRYQVDLYNIIWHVHNIIAMAVQFANNIM